MNKGQKKIAEKFFDTFSPVHALVRVNEAIAIKNLEFKSPVLDLGCGDGRFVLLTFGRKKIDVGLDPNPKEGKKAKKSFAYKRVIISDGVDMPFKDGNFNTVIANSVLEHVNDLDKVLKESARVLNKKGRLIITVPTPLVSEYFFWSKFIPHWANFKTNLWKHINYFGEKEWRRKLNKTGFKIIKIEKTNAKQAILWADIFFPLFPFGPLRFFLPFLEKKKAFGLSEDGATLVILAEKNEK